MTNVNQRPYSVVIMAIGRPALSTPAVKKDRRHPSHTLQRAPCVAQMKARQAAKIREIGGALIAAGIGGLDEQAKALGLSRSTTWTILKGSHKGSGLSAVVINRMLASPRLPPLVRAKILEYIEEKTAGYYGDGQPRLRRFAAGLAFREEHARDRGGMGTELARRRKIA
jgi:hypothetical protein